jgi:hypothetical protein
MYGWKINESTNEYAIDLNYNEWMNEWMAYLMNKIVIT